MNTVQPNSEILMDYLDKILDQEKTSQVAALVESEKLVAAELEYLKLSIDTVRLSAINEKISIVRHSFHHKPEKTVVRSMYKFSLRIAAILILIVGSASLYKYISTNDQSVYNKQFMGYELTNTRGEGTRESETEAYRNRDWNKVIAVYQSIDNKSNKYSFLAAMAEMQLNHFSQAVHLFEEVLNSNSADHSFQDEAEYYLSLAYIMNHQENEGIQLMNKIRANTNHTYNPLALKISDIDMKIIELKK
jgi:hypothetical protein